jgi:hypothetical protein
MGKERELPSQSPPHKNWTPRMMKAMKPLFKSLPEGCDISYKNLFEAKTSGSKFARGQCEQLWRLFHDLADNQFIDRFRFEFEQRWFEMYLGATLRDANLDVSASPQGNGPDFLVDHIGRRIYIEAITPEQGHEENPDRVPDPIYRDAYGRPMAGRVPTDQITMRLAEAFRKKAGAFNRYRRDGIIPRDATCIIAINSRDIPHAWADAKPFWFRALYGDGDQYAIVNLDGGVSEEGRQHRAILHGATGPDGTQGTAYEVAPLLDDRNADIAGVIGSSAGAGFRGPLGDDFFLMRHASPAYPYTPGFLGRGTELTLQLNAAGAYDVETIDYGALEPQGPHTITVGHDGFEHEAQWQVSGRALSVRVASRGYEGILINRGDDLQAMAVAIVKDILRSQGHDA